MSDATRISWTDRTWNPWQGCSRVSPGCKNCYMFAEREGRYGIPSGVVTRSAAATFRKPLSRAWASPAELHLLLLAVVPDVSGAVDDDMTQGGPEVLRDGEEQLKAAITA